MKTLFLALLGCLLLALGIVGVIVPILPGLLFLLLALVCFGTLFPTLRNNLSRHPRFKRYFQRLDAGAHYDALTRCKLAFWAALEAIGTGPKQR
ncbi:MAG: DUF454 family protein [Gammaproteobacteria bacterium]|nr:DUF454 family protein [Gammaproteobacteria bacterium]